MCPVGSMPHVRVLYRFVLKYLFIYVPFWARAGVLDQEPQILVPSWSQMLMDA